MSIISPAGFLTNFNALRVKKHLSFSGERLLMVFQVSIYYAIEAGPKYTSWVDSYIIE
jgi:hypothetical protein